VHAAVFRELERALLVGHGFGVDAYGVLVTLVGAPCGRLAIGEPPRRPGVLSFTGGRFDGCARQRSCSQAAFTPRSRVLGSGEQRSSARPSAVPWTAPHRAEPARSHIVAATPCLPVANIIPKRTRGRT